MVVWWYGGMVVWWYGGMVVWWYGCMVVWWYGGMVVWSYDGMVVCWFTCSADFLLLTRERRMRAVVTVLMLSTWQQVVPVSGNCLKLPSLESNSL